MDPEERQALQAEQENQEKLMKASVRMCGWSGAFCESM